MSTRSEIIVPEIVSAALNMRPTLEQRYSKFPQDQAVALAMRLEFGKEVIKHLTGPLASNEVALHINDILMMLNRNQVSNFMDAWACMFIGESAPLIARAGFAGDWKTGELVGIALLDLQDTNLPPMKMEHAYPNIPLDDIPYHDQEVSKALTANFGKGLRLPHYFASSQNLAQAVPVFNILVSYASSAFLPRVLDYGNVYVAAWKEVVKQTSPTRSTQ